ncbi:MAG TPA: Rrf2 family transcriptional regulator [Actinomycetales bacterium]|nr:Rrf2 family transcriptional regulator [Actinomycetales bacterium]
MNISRHSDLALRTLMLLAVGEDRGDRMTAAIIATSVNASASHVAKIVSRLVELDLIASRRGRGGGLAITDAGRAASVGALLRELEGPGEVIECEGDQPCPLARNCRLRHAFVEAREAFFATLDPLTVADVVRSPTRQVILSLDPAFSPTGGSE